MKNNIQNILLVVAVMLCAGQSWAQTSITVYGNCDMCKTRIENAALTVKGVKSATYSIPQQLLTVQSNGNFDVNELHLAMTKAGHDTEALKANDKAYDALHGCCKYREESTSSTQHSEESHDHEGHNHPHEPKAPLPRIITGHIFELDKEGERLPIIGANIMWKGAETGVVSDVNGAFEIGRIDLSNQLIISYVGYQPDTVDMSDKATLNWILSNDLVLQEVEVTHRKNTSEISMLDPIQTVNIGEEELCKAACCNLSESFETSPAVDVSFTDAVTGTRQIQMLGLAGKYVQITRELIPDIRGLATIYGLTYTPGAWIESIQLSKGTGSVVNGHEGMTGQINVELRKPNAKDNFYLNLYGSEGGRYEGNLFMKQKLNRNLSTAILLHGNTRDRRFDRNDDGFMDSPLSKDVLFINRWKYQHESGWQGQVGFKVNHLNRVAGEMKFVEALDKGSDEIWGSTNSTRRYEGWMKIGKILNEETNSSFGFQLSAITHDQDLTFGLRQYDANQNNLFANFIFQSDIINPKHSIKAGASFNYDSYDEDFLGQEFLRDEKTVGAYAEHTFKATDRMSLVSGLRGDLHNQYGIMVTPRVHFRLALDEAFDSVFRLIAGKGWRTANLFSENVGVLATGRKVSILSKEQGNPYSLNPEEAWNFGTNFTQAIYFNGRRGTISLDYYYTLFNQQIVADFESSADGTVILTNQDDMTDGHSIQLQLDAELLPKFDLRTAYRYNYSEVKYGNEIKPLALTSFHRAFINMAYEAPGQWHFDLTVNWRGPQRIPNTDWLEEEDRLDEMSPDFFTVNAQIRKVFKDNFEIYVGSENLLNYRQDNPIINAATPFADDFDASLVWGPIFGRNVHAGLRYRI